MRPLLILPALSLLAACQPGRDASLAEAQLLYALGQWADARIALMNLLKAEPANAGALTLMARIQIASGAGVGSSATLSRLGDGARSEEHTSELQSLMRIS